MTTEKIHCHPTIILEKAGGVIIASILILLSQAEYLIPFFQEGFASEEDLPSILMVLGLILLLPFFTAGYQFLVWRKTWIYMDGTTLVIERNTLNRKKNTYSLAHISNVNTEQNLFELFMHTSRLKLDMENASDANSRDITILLSMPKALEMKAQLLSFSQKSTFGDGAAPSLGDPSCASFSEILTHCICSLPGYYLISAVIFTALALFLFFGLDLNPSDILFEKKTTSIFMKSFTVCILVFSYIYQIIKRLLGFYQFSVYRQENELMVHYGFFRKQDFTIPIGRIHALQIVQPPIARLTGRCEARIVCIGVGDAQEELTQFSLCKKKRDVLESLAALLPEFPAASIHHMRKPPKHAKILSFCSCFCWIMVCCLFPYMLIASLGPSKAIEDASPLLYACLSLACCILLYYLFRHFCLGFYVGGSFAICSGGSLTKTATIMPYREMQHICFKQNFLSRHFHLYQGEAYILASEANRKIRLPYITEAEKKLLAQEMGHNCPGGS